MIYRLSEKEDLEKIYELLGEERPLGFPTIVADDGELKGVLSTQDRGGMVIAGPYKATSSIVGLRLLQAYENLMSHIGIREYIFPVEKTNEKWLNTVRKGPVEEFDEDHELIWFRRKLNGRRNTRLTRRPEREDFSKRKVQG